MSSAHAVTVLGLDLATQTGWGVLESSGALISWGVFRTNATTKLTQWARLLHNLDSIAEAHPGISHVAMEKAITYGARGRSAPAARVAFGMRAHVEHWAAQRDLTVSQHPPATIKKVAGGSGRARKIQVARLMARRWPDRGIEGLIEADGPFDGTDAIATAVTWLDTHG